MDFEYHKVVSVNTPADQQTPSTFAIARQAGQEMENC